MALMSHHTPRYFQRCLLSFQAQVLWICRIMTCDAERWHVDLFFQSSALCFDPVQLKNSCFFEKDLSSLHQIHNLITIDCIVIGAFAKQTTMGGLCVAIIFLDLGASESGLFNVHFSSTSRNCVKDHSLHCL